MALMIGSATSVASTAVSFSRLVARARASSVSRASARSGVVSSPSASPSPPSTANINNPVQFTQGVRKRTEGLQNAPLQSHPPELVVQLEQVTFALAQHRRQQCVRVLLRLPFAGLERREADGMGLRREEQGLTC